MRDDDELEVALFGAVADDLRQGACQANLVQDGKKTTQKGSEERKRHGVGGGGLGGSLL